MWQSISLTCSRKPELIQEVSKMRVHLFCHQMLLITTFIVMMLIMSFLDVAVFVILSNSTFMAIFMSIDFKQLYYTLFACNVAQINHTQKCKDNACM